MGCPRQRWAERVNDYLNKCTQVKKMTESVDRDSGDGGMQLRQRKSFKDCKSLRRWYIKILYYINKMKYLTSIIYLKLNNILHLLDNVIIFQYQQSNFRKYKTF